MKHITVVELQQVGICDLKHDVQENFPATLKYLPLNENVETIEWESSILARHPSITGRGTMEWL